MEGFTDGALCWVGMKEKPRHDRPDCGRLAWVARWERPGWRGQVPITAEDLLNVGALLETATNIEPGTPSHSKNGAMRIAVETEDQDYRYSIVGAGFNWLIDAVGANSFAPNLLTVRMNSHLRWILG